MVLVLYNIITSYVPDNAQKHIQAVAQNKPVQFNVKNDGDVDLFEMQVELLAPRGGISSQHGASTSFSVGVSTSSSGGP